MKRTSILIFIIILLKLSAYCQANDSTVKFSLPLIAQENQGNSYITFPTDIGNIESLWFEGYLIPNFYLRTSKNSRLMGVLTPQTILRMYQEESYPVRTPSYMPQMTAYYKLIDFEKNMSLTLFGRIAHHSNGQNEDFFLEDGSINLKSGDFSTNFWELGLIATKVSTRFNAHQFLKTSLEVHPKSFSQDELTGIYSRIRWHNAFSIFKLAPDNNPNDAKKPAISLKGETTWMFGRYNNLNALSAERLNLRITFYFHPKFLEDIGLFVQYYHGSDYYNMFFSHRLDILRFGIMTEKLRF